MIDTEVVEKVRERIPPEIMVKLNCVGCLRNHWYEYAYYPMKVLVDITCEVLHEEKGNKIDYADLVDVVNEITDLSFVYDDWDDDWDRGDERLEEMFCPYPICERNE